MGGYWERVYVETFPQDPDGSTAAAGGIIIPRASFQRGINKVKDQDYIGDIHF